MVVAALPTPPLYGPAEAVWTMEFAGDPYDPGQNDVRVSFLHDKGGPPEERLAWYDGNGRWHANLVAARAGAYRATLLRGGKPQGDPLAVRLPETPVNFVRAVPGANRLLAGDKPIFPVGYNLGWRGAGMPPLTETIAEMGAQGLDWARVWACSWDGKNPLWGVRPGNSLNEDSLRQWGEIVDAATKAGVRIQPALFHHGIVSTTVNSNWGDSPWNAGNPGGFLKTPVEWFSDAEAIRRQRIWLRYAVARWGADPTILGWELFNEVEWADAVKARRADVAKWHTDAATYLRSLDVTDRPVLSSSSADLNDDVFKGLDIRQPHVYSPDPEAAVFGASIPRPGWFGEFGESGDPTGGGSLDALRGGTLASLMANHSGLAMFWSWEDVRKKDYGPWFAYLAKVVKETAFAEHGEAKPLALTYAAPRGGVLRARPAGGWGPQPVMPLPMADIGRASSFLQGKGHAEMGQEIAFPVDGPVTVSVVLDTVSKGGASLRLSADGALGEEAVLGPGAADRPANRTLSIKVPAGRHTVRLHNDGGDWVTIARFELPGLAPVASVKGVGEPEWGLLWTRSDVGRKLRIGGLGVPDGTRRIRTYPFDGPARDVVVLVVNGAAEFELPPGGALVWLRPFKD